MCALHSLFSLGHPICSFDVGAATTAAPKRPATVRMIDVNFIVVAAGLPGGKGGVCKRSIVRYAEQARGAIYTQKKYGICVRDISSYSAFVPIIKFNRDASRTVAVAREILPLATLRRWALAEVESRLSSSIYFALVRTPFHINRLSHLSSSKHLHSLSHNTISPPTRANHEVHRHHPGRCRSLRRSNPVCTSARCGRARRPSHGRPPR